MAKIGLNNFRYAILTEDLDGTLHYDGAKKPAKAISCNVNISNNSAKLYADDALAESDSSFQSGTVTIGIDDEDIETMANILGHTVEDGEMIRNSNDLAPFVGFGRIIVKMIGGLYKYKVEFLYKVKFEEPSQDDSTKGENVEFKTTEISGTIATTQSGDWSATKTFDTKADAIEYLEGLLAATEPPIPSSFVALEYTDVLTAKNNLACNLDTTREQVDAIIRAVVEDIGSTTGSNSWQAFVVGGANAYPYIKFTASSSGAEDPVMRAGTGAIVYKPYQSTAEIRLFDPGFANEGWGLSNIDTDTGMIQAGNALNELGTLSGEGWNGVILGKLE